MIFCEVFAIVFRQMNSLYDFLSLNSPALGLEQWKGGRHDKFFVRSCKVGIQVTLVEVLGNERV